MSYHCADVNGYLGDVASIGGLAAFREWAQGSVREFIDTGKTSDLDALRSDLEMVVATDPGIEGTRQAILDCLEMAEEVLIITDQHVEDD